MTETILLIVAHNSDHILEAGGTLAKYAQEGQRIITVVCSYGETSQPHLRKEVVVKRRERESKKADALIGGAGVIYLDHDKYHVFRTIRMLSKIIRQERPSRIFTHPRSLQSSHNVVYKLVMQLAEHGAIKCPIYCFKARGLDLLFTNYLQLMVDTTETFPTKIKAVLEYKSRKMTTGLLLWKILIKDRYTGLLHGTKYAEVFSRIH